MEIFIMSKKMTMAKVMEQEKAKKETRQKNTHGMNGNGVKNGNENGNEKKFRREDPIKLQRRESKKLERFPEEVG
ncbi:MAG: hypothetical protein G01um101418_249 [Parcubacteria group bacterium Gr01-1014_18]|nr:MAG: hypothetical protein Greene041636_216 [Parcubacteria group bacterium Greene0416_36]TSC81267.1 MAG: hypothetical protein G01um101418_249 [Parcubacteria group bacterium Gr01-1014_18]TSC99289.1 MAG: hypothetical protein Greene101420_217 [Parcubacteria group bacterium Greene1014_20]TSD06874.1 MAG: hypothetical protein Greene07142_608 [Parcubacteria group bacterium Greene0714_2]